MGFYGNITNTNKTQFTFDKVYANRKEMDSQVKTDGIYIGRYVLVDYSEQEKVKPWIQLYINPNTGHFLFAPPEENVNETTGKVEYIYQESTRAQYAGKGATLEGYKVAADTIIYVEDGEGTRQYYKCSGSKVESGVSYAVFKKIESEKEVSNYTVNYSIDKDYMSNLGQDVGRGFDSTVWQKVYVEDGEKYVLIAELNSVVPTFDIALDAPTMEPVVPHFDANSTDVYYRLHLQPQWGLRVRAADPEKAAANEAETGYKDYVPTDAAQIGWNKEALPSDEKVEAYLTKYNPSTGIDELSAGTYDGAIYYNKAGFDPLVRSYNAEVKDEISIRPTGASGQHYAIHKAGSAYPTEDVKIDTQEMVVMLPSIGNAISHLWDLVYGDWQYELDGDGNQILDDKGNPIITYKKDRNTNIDWGNRYGLRMVRREKDGNGYEYDPMQVSTVAGCINSVQDLMGAIILDDNVSLQKALTSHIYYGNLEYDPTNPNTEGKKDYRSFYIKCPYYEIPKALNETELEELLNSDKKVDLTQFTAKDYYYTDQTNYYLELTDRHTPGTNYFLKNQVDTLFDPISLVGGYKAKLYHYQNSAKDYICELAYQPDNAKIYYQITEDSLEAVTDVKHNKFLYNPPAEHEITGYDDNNKPLTYTGYFYFDKARTDKIIASDPEKYKDIKIYTKVVATTPYNKDYEYYLGTDYMIGTEASTGGDVFEVYDFAIKNPITGAIQEEYGKLTPVSFVNFTPEADATQVSNFYYLVEDEESETTNYIRLASKDDIDTKINYYTVTPSAIANSATPFYQPDIYFYKTEQQDYVLADELDKVEGLQYYERNSKTISPVTDTFYISNKYYYKDENAPDGYLVDKNEHMTEGRDYYFRKFAYVKTDRRGILSPGAKWNTNIKDIPVDENGDPYITLGDLEEKWCWKELVGFSKNLNTIHGLIVQLNKIIKAGDPYTRDKTTIQGCLNVINDLINNIGNLTPKEVVIVDEYGRMASSPTTTDDWINIAVKDGVKEREVAVTHEFTPTKNDTATIDLNTLNKDTIDLYVPDVDEKGHVVGSTITTATLPYGFKTVKVENSDISSAVDTNVVAAGSVADNTQDTLTFKASNKWIKFDNSEEDIIKVGHSLSAATSGQKFGQVKDLDIAALDENNLFNVPSFTLDEAGHVIEASTQKITLPDNFTKINIQGNSTGNTDSTSASGQIEADNLTDELTVSAGNKWIALNVDSANDGFNIQHYVKQFKEKTGTSVDYNASGNTISVQLLDWDEAGHIIDSVKTEYTLPNSIKTLAIANSGSAKTDSAISANGSLIANTIIDTATIDTANRWIQLVADNPNKTVSIAHAAAGSAKNSAGSSINETVGFGGAFTVPYFTYDEMGHVFSNGERTITLPSAQTTSALTLTDYVQGNSTETIVAADTVNSAFAKLQNQTLLISGALEPMANSIATNSNDIAAEIARATNAEAEIKAAIPTINSTPSTSGYYLLHVKDDGSSEWISVDYTPSVEEEPIPPTEEEVIPEDGE